MIKAKKQNILSIQRELAIALVRFSNGELSVGKAENLSKKVVSKLDFNNSALAHKGVNWCAKDLLSKIDVNALV